MNFVLYLAYGLIGLAVVILSYQFCFWLVRKIQEREAKKIEHISRELTKLSVSLPLKKLKLFSLAAIAAAGVAGFIFMGVIGLAVGASAGFFLPYSLIRFYKGRMENKFVGQIVGAIQILRSGLKSGLSFTQSLEMVTVDMPSPISDEFSLVSKELRMGSSLEDALTHLEERRKNEELSFVISAILVAREVGGDLPSVLEKLDETLRDRARLRENIKTYTLQGRAQAYIISAIPVVFLFIVLQRDRHHFDIMLQNELGRMLLIAAAVLNVVGLFVIFKMSKMKI